MKGFILSLALVSTASFAASPIPDDEMIRAFLQGEREVTSLREITELGLNSGSTALDLWSGSYWPQYQGSLAVRYRDPGFIGLMKTDAQWKKYKELNEKKPVYTYYGKEDLLSPAEKYDLLVGDYEMTLTKYSLALGEKNEHFGKVPTWRGVCDGWSSATQNMPRPAKTVTLQSSEGRPISFYPEDIKALGSLSYARSQKNPILLGKRCINPVISIFTGACNGTNPGALHKALVNRVGKLKKTFIADVSPGAEVWNYPVHHYKLSYYNVLTDEDSESFEQALELFTEGAHFKNKSGRAKSTYAIVGVKAEVTYTDMRPANLLEVDNKELDQYMTKTYYYDLELDRSMNILGGEWASSEQPDFIWLPTDRTYPLSDVEDLSTPSNASDVTRMAKAASKKGQPLAVIIEKLFESAK